MPRLAFLGSKRSGLKALSRLVEVMPPKSVSMILCPDDRTDDRSVLGEFEAAGARYDIPLHVGLRKADILSLLRQSEVAIAVVHGWYQLIPVNDIPEVTFLGFHYSPLPEFRGNAPLVWQILSGRSEIGVSFFQLTDGMDDGPLVDQRTAALGPNETINHALTKADALVIDMIDGFAASLRTEGLKLLPQPERAASYCGLRLPEDGGIDWHWDAQRIHDFVRAQTAPYPGAYTHLADKTPLIIWSSEVEPDHYMGVPGAVAAIRDDHVVVTAGRGAVRLYRVQAGEGDRVSAVTVLKSLRTRLI